MATDELDRYFAGELREFTVPVDLGSISPFDHSVLTGLGVVGYGKTTSYGRLATQLGLTPAAARDVGKALGRNPVLVLVPCHRVIGADGSLIGYAAGLRFKRRLLDLESATITPRLELVW
jgi:methylated-DNA-[protein]-cysteine S-methyltransferase